MLGESSDQSGDLGGRQVAVRVGAFVADPRKAIQPVGAQQPQRVPALGPPRVRDLATLEHNMIDRSLSEEVARGKAGVAGPDDNRREVLDGVCPQATSTVTSVGFVSASKTADRFCDWATSASISCSEASASILNVTLMSLKPFRTSLSTPRIPRMS